MHEGHEVAGEEGEVEDADLLGESDDGSADTEVEVAGRAQEITFLINRTSHITRRIPDNTNNIFLRTDVPGGNSDVIITPNKALIKA